MTSVTPNNTTGDQKRDIGAAVEYVRRDPTGALAFLRWVWGFVAALVAPKVPK